MKMKRSALVYTGLAAFAIAAVGFVAIRNPATAGAGLETAQFAQMREGDMLKLNFHATPKPVPDTPYITGEGGEGRLSDYQGKVILLNFWATWCAPCRKEMPMLSQLQSDLGGDSFAVVTLATGRNMVPAMQRFLDDIGVANLPLHRDPKQLVAREMAVFALPTTILIDMQGYEIARLQGEADWSSENARAIIKAVIGKSAAR
jgi:thiol-disulfide isomerase/thioredoxin